MTNTRVNSQTEPFNSGTRRASTPVEIDQMTMADYDDVLALLRASQGIAIRGVDSRDAVERYLTRNPGLSFVARCATHLIGCVMCGHDGRRGYLQHLAVEAPFQRRGIGTALVERCLTKLKQLGLDKTHLDVLIANAPAHEYWTRRGWKVRDDIVRYSFTNSEDPNA